MAIRAVLASRRFQKEYPEFFRKYAELDRNFRRFLQYRATHRPDEPFNATDSRLSNSKLRKAHLVHGRALLIYQLHGSEIRLISLQEHEGIERGRSVDTRNYARSLGHEDYYLFDVDKAIPEKPEKMTQDAESITDVEAPQLEVPQAELTTDVEAPQVEVPEMERIQVETPPEPETEPPERAEPVASEPAPEPSSDNAVEYLHDQGLLYLPRPAPRPLVIIKLTKELIAPAGDSLGFDLPASAVYHLTEAEVQARYHRDPVHPTTNLASALAFTMASYQRDQAHPVTDISNALAIIMARLDAIERRVTEMTPQAQTMPRHAPPAPPRATRPKPAEPVSQAPDDPLPTRTRPSTRKHDISPQVGRILLAIEDLQNKGLTIDSTMLKSHIEQRDTTSMSAVLWNAHNAGLIKKTPKTGGGFTYRLTPVGQRKAKLLGVWPFTAVNLPVPAYLRDRDPDQTRLDRKATRG